MPTRKLLEGHQRFQEEFSDHEEVFHRLAEEGQDLVPVSQLQAGL